MHLCIYEKPLYVNLRQNHKITNERVVLCRKCQLTKSCMELYECFSDRIAIHSICMLRCCCAKYSRNRYNVTTLFNLYKTLDKTIFFLHRISSNNPPKSMNRNLKGPIWWVSYFLHPIPYDAFGFGWNLQNLNNVNTAPNFNRNSNHIWQPVWFEFLKITANGTVPTISLTRTRIFTRIHNKEKQQQKVVFIFSRIYINKLTSWGISV